jgi:hypothetical protein
LHRGVWYLTPPPPPPRPAQRELIRLFWREKNHQIICTTDSKSIALFYQNRRFFTQPM